MHAFVSLGAFLFSASIVDAAIYVTNPLQATSCAGDRSCQVEWVDDGQAPLLSAIGKCEVGLYTGSSLLAQSLPPVDVSTTSSFIFTPNPSINSNGTYYLVFSASNSSYQSFSGFFTITEMSKKSRGGSPAGETHPATHSDSPASHTDSPSASHSVTAPTSSATQGTTSISQSVTTTTRNTSSTTFPSDTDTAVRVSSSFYLVGLATLFAFSGVFVL